MSVAEKLSTIAENEQRVYEAGKNAQWNETWDGLQGMGLKTDYSNFCSGQVFIIDLDTTPRWVFKPKYNIKPTKATGMFKAFNSGPSGGVRYDDIKIDLAQWLEDLGVVLDTSNCTDVQQIFYNNQGISRVPFLDLSKCTGATSVANFCGQSAVLNTIDGIKSSEDTAWVSTSFTVSNPLKHCIFSGVIGKSLNLGYTKLDYESLMSVLNTLKDLSGTETTLTLTLGTTLLAKLTDAEKAIATEKGWTLS